MLKKLDQNYNLDHDCQNQLKNQLLTENDLEQQQEYVYSEKIV